MKPAPNQAGTGLESHPAVVTLLRGLRASLVVALGVVGASPTLAQDAARLPATLPCGDCALALVGMPERIDSHARIAPSAEDGEPMTMRGTEYASAGRTPAPGVIVYAYHTNAGGRYPRIWTGPARFIDHGRLRGWARSGTDGEFEFRTIRPGPYPFRSDPAHVHTIVIEPGSRSYWIDDIVFSDDPRVTPEWRAERSGRGGDGVTIPTRAPDGSWKVRRDIFLMASADPDPRIATEAE